jgi:hypothetical protein
MGPPARKLLFALALILAIAGTFVFGFRAGTHARQIRRHNEPIRPWMSLPFIAHTQHVRQELLYRAIGLEPREHDRRPLRVIARQENRSVANIIRDLENTIASAPRSNPDGKAPERKGP